MKYLICLLLLLGSCIGIKNADTTHIAVSHNRILLSDGEHITTEDNTAEITFVFFGDKVEGLSPRIHFYGDGKLIDGTTSGEIEPNKGYKLVFHFRTPGRMSILLIWEGVKERHGSKIIIHIDNP